MEENERQRQARLLAAARGERPADLVITGARVANLYTREWRREEVAVSEGVIIGVGQGYEGPRLEVAGYLLPGFLDGHLHVESSMLTPRELARALVPRGTTAVVADPHEIVNVWGSRGLDYLLQASAGLPLDFFFMLPSCVPASPLSAAGVQWGVEDMAPYLSHPRVLGLAEVMNFPGVVAGNPELLEKIALFERRPVDGHAPLLSGKALQAYRLAGIGSDHECTTLAEAREKLRLGFHLMLREGSLARNLTDLLPAVTPATTGQISMVCDDLHPTEVLERGHLDHLLRRAVAAGLEPLQAVALVTLNPARWFGFRDRGALAPGMRADLVLVRDWSEFQVERVWKDGRLVAEGGRLRPDLELPSHPAPTGSLRVAPLPPQAFSPRIDAPRVRVIGLIPGQILTEELIVPTPRRDGRLAADPARDLLKLAVVERHQASGRVGVGLVRGFGLARGALASTVAHDSHNLVIAGVEDEDMHLAARHLTDLGGGLAVAAGGRILADLPLPVAGLLSPAPVEEVAAAHQRLREAYHSLGGALPDPFMALSFLSLEVIPALKLTHRGLVEVHRFEIVPLGVEESGEG